MERAETPIPKEHLLDERETHMGHGEEQEEGFFTGTTGVRKGRGFSDKMEEFWKGKTIYKIKGDYEIPHGLQKSDIARTNKISRGNIDDLFHPESASSSKPVSVQNRPGSQQGEAGKKLLRGPGLRQVEVGPAPAKRHVGKQKPVLVDEGSSK